MGAFDAIIPEYTYGSSRFDFYMEAEGKKYLKEVKGCTLTSGTGTALFPDAPSKRAVKHLDELAVAAQEGYFSWSEQNPIMCYHQTDSFISTYPELSLHSYTKKNSQYLRH